MRLHASCAAWGGNGVLILGEPGSGKSDLLLQLMNAGFDLVADDQVEIIGGVARPADGLGGLLEVRGLGIIRVPFRASVRLALAVELQRGPRLPEREYRHGLPLVYVDPCCTSAPSRVSLALECLIGQRDMVVGAFT